MIEGYLTSGKKRKREESKSAVCGSVCVFIECIASASYSVAKSTPLLCKNGTRAKVKSADDAQLPELFAVAQQLRKG